MENHSGFPALPVPSPRDLDQIPPLGACTPRRYCPGLWHHQSHPGVVNQVEDSQDLESHAPVAPPRGYDQLPPLRACTPRGYNQLPPLRACTPRRYSPRLWQQQYSQCLVNQVEDHQDSGNHAQESQGPESSHGLATPSDSPPGDNRDLANHAQESQGPESSPGLATPSFSPPVGCLDVAPDSRIVFRPSNSLGEPHPSRAEAKQKLKGIYSHDPILDRSPDELWRFLAANLRQPRLAVLLFGQHTKEKDGKFPSTVTDFCIEIDTSRFVTQWSQLYAHPNGASFQQLGTNGASTTAGPTLRETMEEYTRSRNPFKECRMRKRVVWDTWQVRQSLKELVRCTGYRHDVYVQFPMEDYKVVALASNKYSKSANSLCVRGLCCMSCLCIGFWPAWAIARKRMKVTCEYLTTQTADEFLLRNSSMIQSAVLGRWTVSLPPSGVTGP